MPSPGANLLLALATFISGGVFAVSGWLWLFGFVALIAGAIFQSALIWYLVVLYVVGMFVVTPIVDTFNPARTGDDSHDPPNEASSGSGGMEG